MEVITDIPFTLDKNILLRRMHIKSESREAHDFLKLIEQAEEIGNPKALYKESYIEAKGKGTVTIDNVVFTSTALRNNLEGIERVFPYIVTCGSEFEEADLTEGDFLKAFWLDCIKEETLRISRLFLRERISSTYKLGKTSTMNPGSGDAAVWPIEQQKELFALFGNVEELIGVELTDSFLMKPNKSVSGIRFPNEIGFETCQLCHRENCTGRRAPFNEELWKSMHNN